jgi:hypothetical protein
MEDFPPIGEGGAAKVASLHGASKAVTRLLVNIVRCSRRRRRRRRLNFICPGDLASRTKLPDQVLKMASFTRISDDETPTIIVHADHKIAKINDNIYGGFTE